MQCIQEYKDTNMINIWEQLELAREESKPKNIIEISPYLCSYCKSSNLNEDRSEGGIVCIDCGAVKASTLIDDTAEWNFGGDDANDKAITLVTETSEKGGTISVDNNGINMGSVDVIDLLFGTHFES